MHAHLTGGPDLPPLDDRLKEKLEGLSAEAQAAYHSFRDTGDTDMLDRAVAGAIGFLVPGAGPAAAAAVADDAHLIDDLGFDSIAMTELVFLAEDIFGIAIADEEIRTLGTVAEVKAFMRARLAAAGTQA